MKDFYKKLAATVSGCPIVEDVKVEPKKDKKNFDKDLAASMM